MASRRSPHPSASPPSLPSSLFKVELKLSPFPFALTSRLQALEHRTHPAPLPLSIGVPPNPRPSLNVTATAPSSPLVAFEASLRGEQDFPALFPFLCAPRRSRELAGEADPLPSGVSRRGRPRLPPDLLGMLACFPATRSTHLCLIWPPGTPCRAHAGGAPPHTAAPLLSPACPPSRPACTSLGPLDLARTILIKLRHTPSVRSTMDPWAVSTAWSTAAVVVGSKNHDLI
jgi:hypothetical protein